MAKKMYLAGDIMTLGARLARQHEYDLFKDLDYDIYSPVLNKSINDKNAVTEEENNHLAEKIVAADCLRLDNSDVIVFCPEQSAIGTMCEVGYVLGRKALAERILELVEESTECDNAREQADFIFYNVCKIADEIKNQQVYFHYEDLRDTTLNESGWRRSFGINQFLYGSILELNENGIQSLEEIRDELDEKL